MCGSWLPYAKKASFVETGIGCVCDSVLGKPRFWSCRGPKDQSRAQHESALKAATLQTNSVSKSVSHYPKTEPWVIYRFDPTSSAA